MKLTLFKGALAFAAASVIAASAHAQTYINQVNDGDLIFTARATSGQGSGYDLEVDLGPFSNFLPGGIYATGAAVSLSNFAVSDMSTTTGPAGDASANNAGFGSNWFSDGLVKWSVVGSLAQGGQDGLPNDTVFGTDNAGRLSAATIGNQDNAASNIFDMNNQLNNYYVTNNTNEGSFVPVGGSGSFNQDSGGSAPYFQQTSFQNNFESTATSSSVTQLDYQVPGSAGIDLGNLTLSTSGLTFQSVPEPSTWASLVVGAASLLGLRRRRRA